MYRYSPRSLGWIVFLSLLLFLPAAWAGVSVSFVDDAIPCLKRDPALIELLQKSFDIEEVGWAKDGGRSFSNSSGERTLPYGFRAKPKGQAGAYTVLVLLEANDNNNGVVLTILPLSAAQSSLNSSESH